MAGEKARTYQRTALGVPPAMSRHPPREVSVHTTLPLTGGEHAHGHAQPRYPRKYPRPNSAASGRECAGTPTPQSRPCQGKQDRGTVPVPLRMPRGGLEVQRSDQHAPREQRHACPTGFGVWQQSGDTASIHHPCGITNASHIRLITALISICRQGLAAPAFTTLALLIGDL